MAEQRAAITVFSGIKRGVTVKHCGSAGTNTNIYFRSAGNGTAKDSTAVAHVCSIGQEALMVGALVSCDGGHKCIAARGRR